MAKDHRAMDEAYVKGNVDAFDETHAPSVVTHIPPFPDAKGREAYKQVITEMRQAFSNIRLDWDETISEGNTITHRFTVRMKHTGVYPSIPVPPTGKEAVVKGGVFLHVKRGKIAEVYQYGDWLGMMQQLGAIPAK